MKSNYTGNNSDSESKKTEKAVEVSYKDSENGKGTCIKISVDKTKILSPEFLDVCIELLAQDYAHELAEFLNAHNRAPESVEEGLAVYGKAEKIAKFEIVDCIGDAVAMFIRKNVMNTETRKKAHDRAVEILKRIAKKS